MGSDNNTHSTLQFFQKDYELKINYLVAHFSRMWTRFNFFIVLETALAALIFNNVAKSVAFWDNAYLLSLVGLVSSIAWYFVGAQDRYLVEVYRKQAQDAGKIIGDKLALTNYIPVPNQKLQIKQKWYEYLYQWRFDRISTTKFAALFPLLVVIFWITILIWAAGRTNLL